MSPIVTGDGDEALSDEALSDEALSSAGFVSTTTTTNPNPETSSPSTPPSASRRNRSSSTASAASLTPSLAATVLASSVCLATIFSSLRSSLSLPSSLRYLAHSSGSTTSCPAAICARSASARSSALESSLVWSLFARPPR